MILRNPALPFLVLTSLISIACIAETKPDAKVAIK